MCDCFRVTPHPGLPDLEYCLARLRTLPGLDISEIASLLYQVYFGVLAPSISVLFQAWQRTSRPTDHGVTEQEMHDGAVM